MLDLYMDKAYMDSDNTKNPKQPGKDAAKLQSRWEGSSLA